MANVFSKFLNGSSFTQTVAKYLDGNDVRYANLTNDVSMGEAVAAPATYSLLGRIKALLEATPGLGTSFGVSGAVVTAADVSTATAVTDAPGASLKLVVDSVVISSAAAVTVDLQEETSGTIIAKFYMPVNSTVTFKPEGKVKLATANKKLMVHASGAGAVSVTAVYHTEA